MLPLIFTNCGDDDDPMVPLPAIIENYLTTNYPDYSVDESEKEILCDGTVVYEVELEDSNDNEMELTFDTEGSFLFSEHEIGNGDLPSVVTNSITNNYPDYSIEETERLDMFDSTTRYEVEIKNGSSVLEVLLEAEGTVVCQAEDTDD